MKKMKKVLSALLAFALLFTMVGCSGEGSAQAGSNRLQKILDAGTLRVGMIPDNPGWSTMDANGNWTGYDADIAKMMAEALGVDVEYVVTDGAGRIPLIQTDKVDIVISCFAATNERAKTVGLSDPYAASGLLPICRKGEVLASWEDMADKKIAVARGSTIDIFATEAYPNAEIMRFDSIADAFMALKSKKADVMIEEDTAIYDLSKNNPNDVEIMAVEPRAASLVCMGFAPDDQVWINFVNKFIEISRKSGKLDEFYLNNFNKELPNF